MICMKKGSGSINAGLFWYKDGLLTKLFYIISDNTIQFFPPEEYEALVEKLSQREK